MHIKLQFRTPPLYPESLLHKQRLRHGANFVGAVVVVDHRHCVQRIRVQSFFRLANVLDARYLRFGFALIPTWILYPN